MAAILFAIAMIFYYVKFEGVTSVTRTEDVNKVRLAQKIIIGQLQIPAAAVLFLAQQQNAVDWLAEQDDMDVKAKVLADMTLYMKRYPFYDQLRFINASGHEVIRINHNDDQPIVVPEDQLQDKSGRYYVEAIRELASGQLYLSPLDLNVEQGVIDEPYKAVLRIGTPAYDEDGFQGSIILNYNGTQYLLSELRNLNGADGRQLWLINDQGYWLQGASRDDEWAFMWPDRSDRTVSVIYPDLWNLIAAGEQNASHATNQGLFSYTSINAADFLPDTNQRILHLVAFTPQSYLDDQSSEIATEIASFTVPILVLIALVSLMLARKEVARFVSEVKLQEQEKQQRSLLEGAPDAIVIVNRHGDIYRINTEAERMFGYDRDELIGQPVEVLLPERFRKHHLGFRKSYIENPTVRPMGQSQELFARRKDGSELPVEISLSPLNQDNDTLVTAVVRDVTVRKQQDILLREREQQSRGLLEGAPDAIVIVDRNGEIHLINTQAEQMFGYDRDEIIGQPVEVLLPERFRNHHIDYRKGYIKHPTVRPMGQSQELFAKRKDGSELPVEISLSPMTQGSNTLVTAVIRDVSVRRERENKIKELNQTLVTRSGELEVINKELEAFSYSVSHDLRAPLRAVDGFSHNLLQDYREQLDERGRDRLERIRAAAQRMASLIDDLLTLSRISRAEVNKKQIDITGLCQEIADELQRQTPNHEVEFIVEPGLSGQADARLLSVAMTNLLSNAWKFTSQVTGARIEVSADCGEEEWVYSVADNGAGFNMAYADKLFGAFQRLHDVREFPGTGIGLATVQRVIHKHGGRVWAEAEEGKGARFFFTLGTVSG